MIDCLRLICLAVLFLAGCATGPSHQSEWLTIFDGASLQGWTPKVAGEDLGKDSLKTFRANHGILSVNYGEYDGFQEKFAHLFYDRKLSNYRLKLEYRFVGEQIAGGAAWAHLNSGVMLHSQDPKTIDFDQNFPVSVEAQFLAVSSQFPDQTTSNVCTPGTHIVMGGELTAEHCVNSKIRGSKSSQWVKFEADVRGNDKIRLYINDVLALEFSEPQLDPDDIDAKVILGSGLSLSSGYIALQSESHPIEFRNIQLLDRADIAASK